MLNSKISRKRNIASIVELFLMFLLLLVVIVVITMVCMTTREQSLKAHTLTEAVLCAENTAEVTKYAENAEEAASRIEQMEGVSDVAVSGDVVTASVDGYQVEVAVTPDPGSSGTYMDTAITIFPASSADSAIYELHTGSYRKEGKQ